MSKKKWCYTEGIDDVETVHFYQDVFGSLSNKNDEKRNNRI